MPGWVILVDNIKDLPNEETPHKVITVRDYINRPTLFPGDRPKIINLSRSFAYQSQGYYASLLGEARRHRVIPNVETMLELGSRSAYAHALPELEEALHQALKKRAAPERLLICFGEAMEPGFERFSRLLFDWFRAPILEVTLEIGEWTRIRRIRTQQLRKLAPDERAHFDTAIAHYTRRDWRSPKARKSPRYTLAVLHDPREALPPSALSSLRHMARVAEKQDVEIELITRKDLPRLAEFDALFIRETTSIDNHTFRFARRATQEGMPVIDGPVSMIRCTNKIYLNELLTANGIAMPPTVILSSTADIAKVESALGYPFVMKIPDGSFSRGVKKIENRDQFMSRAREWFEDTDLLLAQKYMPTAYDWRITVLDGEPLFACRYMMAKGHWQIIQHGDDGSAIEGGVETVDVRDAPPEAIRAALSAAKLIGDGLYGVDIKETPEGVFVIEVNDNPNVDHGFEDLVARDKVWEALIRWFVTRIERRR